MGNFLGQWISAGLQENHGTKLYKHYQVHCHIELLEESCNQWFQVVKIGLDGCGTMWHQRTVWPFRGQNRLPPKSRCTFSQWFPRLLMRLIYASFVFQEVRKDLNQVNQHVLQLAEVVKDVLSVWTGWWMMGFAPRKKISGARLEDWNSERLGPDSYWFIGDLFINYPLVN